MSYIETDLTEDSKAYISVGKQFSSYEALQQAVNSLQNESFQLFSKIHAAVLKPNDTIAKDAFEIFRYKVVQFICVHFGHPRQRGTGKRPSQMYNNLGCQSHFWVRYSKKQNALVVTSCNFTHRNHECKAEHFSKFPRNRKLDGAAQKEVKELSELALKKTALVDHIRSKYKKEVTSKDLSNLLARLNKEALGDTQMEKVLKILNDEKASDPDACVRVVLDSSETSVEIIYYCSSKMKELYRKYGDVLLVDGTYRLNDCRYPLYVFLVIDGDGRGVVVGFGFIASEDQAHVEECIKTFVDENDGGSRSKIVMIDKDFVEITSVTKCFPKSCTILLCDVHVDRNFDKLVQGLKFSKEQMEHFNDKNTEEVRKEIRSLLCALLNCSSKEGFDRTVQKLEDDKRLPPDFMANFRANWLGCKSMWAKYARMNLPHLGKHNTNALEAQNKHIKDAMRKNYSSMSDCVLGLMRFARLHNKNREFREFKSSTKTTAAALGARSDTEREIFRICTEVAAKRVVNELRSAQRYAEDSSFSKPKCVTLASGEFQVTFSDKQNVVNAGMTACNCCLYANTCGLVCAHIFYVRLIQNAPLFVGSLVPSRWQRNFLREFVTAPRSTFVSGEQNTSSEMNHFDDDVEENKISGNSNKSTLDKSARYAKSMRLFKQFSFHLGDLSRAEYDEKLIFLNNLLSQWRSGVLPKLLDVQNEIILVGNDALGAKTDSAMQTDNILESDDIPVKQLRGYENISVSAMSFANKRMQGNVSGSSAKQPNYRKVPKSIRELAASTKLSQQERELLEKQNALPVALVAKASLKIKAMQGMCGMLDPFKIKSNAKGKPFARKGKFVQILQVAGDQYVTVSFDGNAFEKTVNVYSPLPLTFPDPAAEVDEHNSQNFSSFFELQGQVSKLLSFADDSHFKLAQLPVTEAIQYEECAYICIASAFDLIRGRSPSTRQYLVNELAESIIRLIDETDSFSRFKSKPSVVPVRTLIEYRVKLYCVCKSTYDPAEACTMVECSKCEDWFHNTCLEIPANAIDEEEFEWKCPNCQERTPFTSPQGRRKSSLQKSIASPSTSILHVSRCSAGVLHAEDCDEFGVNADVAFSDLEELTSNSTKSRCDECKFDSDCDSSAAEAKQKRAQPSKRKKLSSSSDDDSPPQKPRLESPENTASSKQRLISAIEGLQFPKWGGSSYLDTEQVNMINTCPLDNFLAMFYLHNIETKGNLLSMLKAYSFADTSVAILCQMLELASKQQFSMAKLLWGKHIGLQKNRTNAMDFEESQEKTFTDRFGEQFSLSAKSACTNANCKFNGVVLYRGNELLLPNAPSVNIALQRFCAPSTSRCLGKETCPNEYISVTERVLNGNHPPFICIDIRGNSKSFGSSHIALDSVLNFFDKIYHLIGVTYASSGHFTCMLRFHGIWAYYDGLSQQKPLSTKIPKLPGHGKTPYFAIYVLDAKSYGPSDDSSSE